jgi:endonuclease/exonuclease/phosphatase (EEP) superfamily protein YafD
MFHRLFRLLVLSLAIAGTSAAQSPSPLRIATYNLLQFPGAERTAAFGTVVAAMHPDVIVAQEIESADGVALFRDAVLDAAFDGRWEAAPYVDASTDSESAFFYDTTRATYLGMEIVRTPRRSILGYRFAVNASSDTVWIFSVHLKADDGSAFAAQRAEEAQLLRTHLDTAHAGQNVIAAGDFNTYRSDEPALTVLLGEEGNAAARLVDPLGSVGVWHSNAAFAPLHTQSTRVEQFGGGVGGGLDDRFDLMLVSSVMISKIDPASYTAYGNDGRHFNDNVNTLPTGVFASIAQALYDASDHLPVYADFQFGPAAAPIASETIAISVAPNPAGDIVRFVLGEPARNAALTVYDAQGSLVARIELAQGSRMVSWRCDGEPSGIYTYRMTNGGRSAAGTISVVH